MSGCPSASAACSASWSAAVRSATSCHSTRAPRSWLACTLCVRCRAPDRKIVRCLSAPLSCRVLDTKGPRFTLLEPVRSSWYSGGRGLQIRPVTPVLVTTVARNLGRARAQEAIRVSFSRPTLGCCSGPEHRPYRGLHGRHHVPRPRASKRATAPRRLRPSRSRPRRPPRRPSPDADPDADAQLRQPDRLLRLTATIRTATAAPIRPTVTTGNVFVFDVIAGTTTTRP